MKVLIIRFSSIGDIILTTPVIRCLKHQKNAEVHFLTKKKFSAVVNANPYIDRLITIEKEVKKVLPELKAQQYDWVIDLHKNLRTLQVKRALKVPSKSFDKINLEKWLMVNLKMDRLPEKHIVDREMETVESLGIVNDGNGLDYFIPEKDQVNLGNFFDAYPSIKWDKTSDQYSYIAFVIGAAHDTKRFPLHKVIEVSKASHLPVVILGGPGEKEEGDQIAKEAGEHVINTCGALNLNQSASMVQQATKVITNDTGLMHMAAAFGKEIISIWGNTIPKFGMYPYYPEGVDLNTTIEVQGLSCRPCSKIGYQKCPKGHFNCMEKIKAERIINLINTP